MTRRPDRPYAGRGRPPTPRYRDPHQSCRDLAVAAGRAALKTVTWRHGTKTDPDNPAAAMRSRFLALRIRPANRDITPADDGSLPEAWLLAEWPTGAKEPTDYWISTLDPDTPLKEARAPGQNPLAHRTRLPGTETALGLDHFEGRSWTGWHHHATLVTTAHLFLTTLRLTNPKTTGQD